MGGRLFQKKFEKSNSGCSDMDPGCSDMDSGHPPDTKCASKSLTDFLFDILMDIGLFT